MRVSEYAPNTKQELDEIWAGLRGIAKWLSTVVPSDSTSMMGGRAEMQDYVNKNVRDMMRLVGRYTDKNDRPISNKTLHELPIRAIYLFMRGGLKLSDTEIQAIMQAASKNRKLERFKPAKIITINDMKGDSTLDELWPGINSDNATEILQKLVGIASVRRMEQLQFGDVDQGTQQVNQKVNTQTYQKSNKQTEPAAAAQTTAPAAPTARRVALQQALNQLLSQP